MKTNGQKHPKYKVAQLLREKFGELGLQEGKKELSQFCKLRNRRTIAQWMQTEAGSSYEIGYHILERVLAFFDLTEHEQLYSDAHKLLLKKQSSKKQTATQS